MLRDLSVWHIAILLVIILLVFGAKRLPEMGASMGKGIREFKKSLSDMGSSLESGEHRDAVPPARDTESAGTRAAQHEGEPKKLSQ